MVEAAIIEALRACLPEAADQALLAAWKPGQDFRLDQLDMTSLRMVETGMHLEETLGIDVNLEGFEAAETLGDLTKLCETLLAEA